MEPVVLVLLVVGIVALAFWMASQTNYVFLVKIEDGRPRTVRGKVAASFLQIIAEACDRNGVLTGWIGGIRKGRRITLRFSGPIPPGCQQQLRNEWVMG